MLLGRQRLCFVSISPSNQLDKRDRKAFSGKCTRRQWMSAPQRLRALVIPGLWGLSMGSVHDIHYKARLRKSQRLVSNLSAAKETPADLNSMCGAKGTALRLQPAWNDEELCSEAIPTPAFIPGDVIDPQAGFRGNTQLPFPQLTACTLCLRHCSGASLPPRHLSHQLAPGKVMETWNCAQCGKRWSC